jgi:hypothetical protein
VRLLYQLSSFISVDAQIDLEAKKTCADVTFPVIEKSQENGVIASHEQYGG